MDAQGNIIVFGSLLAVVAAIVGGAILGGPWGHGLLALGCLGAVAWLIAAFWLANAMNSDI